MTTPRVPIFDRLPAIHRIRDAEQRPPDQLRAFTSLFERAFGEIHADIEGLYHDLFIDTCADWVIPYLADLLGQSHLSGDPWTLRAEIADTIALRRRKGTRGAIELLAFDLTGWAVHAVELRDHIVWHQHLNHQRENRGTVLLRHPATLSLLDTPFDPFGHLPDLRPAGHGAVRHNLPNLAIYTWRLTPYTVPVSEPVSVAPPVEVDLGPSPPPEAAPWVAQFEIHPVAEPVVLFNRHHFDADARPLQLGALDGMPGPIPRARLTSGAPDGRPEAYVSIDLHDPGAIDLGDRALQLHIPEDATAVPAEDWRFRGANLCAWELGLATPLARHEVAIDPVIGRLLFGLSTEDNALALIAGLRVTYTYGALGPIGAHPISRTFDRPATVRVPTEQPTIAAALATAGSPSLTPLIIELVDSGTHAFDPAAVSGSIDEGGPTILLARDVTIRAASGQRPVVQLARMLAVRAMTPGTSPRLRLEGLYLTRGETFPIEPGEALIRRAAIGTLELDDCTLDPGGWLDRHGDHRAPIRVALVIAEEAGVQTPPEIHVRRCITGPIKADRTIRLFVTDSIVDAGVGPYEPVPVDGTGYAIQTATGDPMVDWGPRTQLDGVTLFGRTRVQRAGARGAIFAQPVEVLDDQHGCFKHCWMPALGNRTPQRFACLLGDDARLRFTSEIFGHPAYGQLADAGDWRIRDRGPDDDHLGASNFLRHAHAIRNLRIRLRELMPVGIQPHLVPVT